MCVYIEIIIIFIEICTQRLCPPKCVCVLRILIMKYKILPFSNYNMRIYSFL
jgi:hypothetical protein